MESLYTLWIHMETTWSFGSANNQKLICKKIMINSKGMSEIWDNRYAEENYSFGTDPNKFFLNEF
jgi:hypothetical protein